MRHPVLANNIRHTRNLLGRTQEAVASAAGMDRTLYQRHESHAENPNLWTLLKIADALDTTLEALARGVTLETADLSDEPRAETDP